MQGGLSVNLQIDLRVTHITSQKKNKPICWVADNLPCIHTLNYASCLLLDKQEVLSPCLEYIELTPASQPQTSCFLQEFS